MVVLALRELPHMKFRWLLLTAVCTIATIVSGVHAHTDSAVYIFPVLFFAALTGHFLGKTFLPDLPVWDMDDHHFINAVLSVKVLPNHGGHR
jgi:hypothetical protein